MKRENRFHQSFAWRTHMIPASSCSGAFLIRIQCSVSLRWLELPKWRKAITIYEAMLSRSTIIIIAPFQRNFTKFACSSFFFSFSLHACSSLSPIAALCTVETKWKFEGRATKRRKTRVMRTTRSGEIMNAFSVWSFRNVVERCLNRRCVRVCVCVAVRSNEFVYVIEFWYSRVCDFQRNNIILAFFTINSQFLSFSSAMCVMRHARWKRREQVIRLKVVFAFRAKRLFGCAWVTQQILI